MHLKVLLVSPKAQLVIFQFLTFIKKSQVVDFFFLLTLNYWIARSRVSFFASDLPGCEVLLLKAPLITVGFIIVQVLPHHLVFGLKQEVTERAGHCLPAVVHWTNTKAQRHKMKASFFLASQSEGELNVVVRSSAAGRKLTFIVGVLEVVVNVGHKVLHKMPPDVWHQVVLTLEFAPYHMEGGVWGWKSERIFSTFNTQWQMLGVFFFQNHLGKAS